MDYTKLALTSISSSPYLTNLTMKRKLNGRNVPSTEAKDAATSLKSRFDDFGLDARLLQAILTEKYTNPTPVQAKVIPLALQGRDILAKAKTGSGKTAAYVLPLLQSLLTKKRDSHDLKSTSTLVLVPTRELAEQVHKSFGTFLAYCGKELRCFNLTQCVPDSVLRSALSDFPDIIISTPGKVCQSLSAAMFSLKDLQHLIIDEADLVLSYGYENDINNISQQLAGGVQTILMSATLSTDVETLKGRFCSNPIIINLEEKDDEGGVTQYVVRCAEDEKFLLTYVVLKLQLIKGKIILFVADIDRSYRLKLFLEQFGIKSCVLNSELPVNSRIHAVEEFNKGVYNILIAVDDKEILGDIPSRTAAQVHSVSDTTVLNDDTDEGGTNQPNKRQRLSNKSKDYGVSRGIDFQDVTCVLNFDLPSSSKAYTHRIGRTARAGKSGMALSFVIPTEMCGKHKPTSIRSAKHDEKILAKILASQAKKGKEVKPYHFDMKQVDVFRYRMSDALRAVTRPAVREARARELKQELIKSEKLKKHFEERPEDLCHLRHDGEVRAVKVHGHLKHVPDYLMPAKGRRGLATDDFGFVRMRRTTENRIRKARGQNRTKGNGRFASSKRTDPLKSFNSRTMVRNGRARG